MIAQDLMLQQLISQNQQLMKAIVELMANNRQNVANAVGASTPNAQPAAQSSPPAPQTGTLPDECWQSMQKVSSHFQKNVLRRLKVERYMTDKADMNLIMKNDQGTQMGLGPSKAQQTSRS
jgi:DNA-nicking Smr family endonuclease